MTGDELAKLRDIYLIKNEKPEEFIPQARPNVLFEAGMAFGRNPDKTIIVELGKTRKYSDVEGRHVIRIDNTPEKRNELVRRLKNAGCTVKNEEKDDWYKEGDFEAAFPPDYSPDEIKPDISSDGAGDDENKVIINHPDIKVPMLKNLSEDEQNILISLNDFSNTAVETIDVSRFLKIKEGRTKYYLNQLVKIEYVHAQHFTDGRTEYSIRDKGLAYLVERDII